MRCIVVSESIWRENPLGWVIEAMACGTPVIVIRTARFREVIEGGALAF